VVHVNISSFVEDFDSLLTGSDNLSTRIRALQKKQRSGNVARSSSKILPNSPSLQSPLSIPDFTPFPRLPPLRGPQAASPTPITNLPVANSPFNELASPRSLQAYSCSSPIPRSISRNGSIHDILPPSFPATASLNSQDERETLPESIAQPASSIGKRMKGFLFSYLPILSKPIPAPKPMRSRPGLPLPPQEILHKARAPISTPIRHPLARPVPHKELVRLQTAPIHKNSSIPRAAKPQRLVELHPITPPASAHSHFVPRPRRSSGGSVKDLIRSFEELQQDAPSKSRRLDHLIRKGNPSESKPAWRF
jgi:hypothetical protein